MSEMNDYVKIKHSKPDRKSQKKIEIRMRKVFLVRDWGKIRAL